MFSSTPSIVSVSEIVTADGSGVIMEPVVPVSEYVCAPVSPFSDNEYDLVADSPFSSLVWVFEYVHSGAAPGERDRLLVGCESVYGAPGEWNLSVGVQSGAAPGDRDRVGE